MNERERIQGALWGAVVGDALGVPVEFVRRSERVRDPVNSMRGGGTWNQPPGTWSDDSSLMLCTVEGLLDEFDPEVLAQRFVDWRHLQIWTPWGTTFDIGVATRQALDRVGEGIPAEMAGGTSEYSNGNGSLMRILPVALRFPDDPVAELAEKCRRVSAITHRHPRSQMACTYYCLAARRLLNGELPRDALGAAGREFETYYRGSSWREELSHFRHLTSGEFAAWKEDEVQSGGYVVHTLTASFWCLLQTTSFREAVLRAVNLGEDTDTTGSVAGGLAGLVYGESGIPPEWIGALARKGDLEGLIHEFVGNVAI